LKKLLIFPVHVGKVEHELMTKSLAYPFLGQDAGVIKQDAMVPVDAVFSHG
jgi:hypothetical protein